MGGWGDHHVDTNKPGSERQTSYVLGKVESENIRQETRRKIIIGKKEGKRKDSGYK